MIEGLRVAPWLHEARRRNHNPDYPILDCTTCKENMPQLQRQALGCGWEPRSELVSVKTWSPRDFSGNDDWSMGIYADDRDPKVCPGYTSALPEVIEISRARVHWKEGGGLRDFCDDTPTEMLRQGVEILEGASNQLQRWVMDHPEKKD